MMFGRVVSTLFVLLVPVCLFTPSKSFAEPVRALSSSEFNLKNYSSSMICVDRAQALSFGDIAEIHLVRANVLISTNQYRPAIVELQAYLDSPGLAGC